MIDNFYKTRLLIITILLLAGIASDSFAQQKSVTGNVISESGEPLSGASVVIKGSGKGTATDAQGNFTLSISNPNATLIVSSLGYATNDVLLHGESSVIIKLVSANRQIEQVVVVGYGTQRKKDLTGSSASVKGSDIANIPALTATQAIQGKVAGVQITSSGAPGSAPNVRIRGVGSILGGVDPLYVVDGIITTDIRNINSNDIVSVDILKDASSTAIYGARAANGVVLITTKAGSKTKFNVSYNGYAGVKILTHKVDLAGPGLYTLYSNEAAGANVITNADITGSTNWYDEITHPAFMQNHNISLSGGKNKYRYFISGGYLKEEGILKGNDYQRINFRYNSDITISAKLKAGTNLSYSHYVSNNKPYSVFTSAYNAAPLYKAKNADGSYGSTSKSDVGNPLATLEYTHDKSYGNRAEGSVWGEYKITRNLSFRSSFGIDAEQNNGQNYVPVYQVGTTTQRNMNSQLYFSADSIYQYVWDNYFTYNKLFGTDHNLTVTAGHTAERRNGWTQNSSKSDVVNDKSKWKLNFTDTAGGQQNIRRPIGNYYKRESYFIRTNYRFKDKYLVNATFRRDANSNFSPSHRWANFPSVGLGWAINKEAFMSHQKTFDNLKLRASYGFVGNDVIGPNSFLLAPTDQLYAYFGSNRVNGAIPTGIVDPNLQWEVTKEFDLGLEFSALNGNLTGEIDYYNKKATKALYIIPIVNVGFGSSFLTNAADILNKGLELSLGWNKTVNSNFKYAFRGNITLNKNRVENVGSGKALDYGSLNNGFSATRTIVGQPIGSFWVYKTNGIYQTSADVAATPHVTNTQAGDLKIVDTNGDGVIDDNDRIYVGSYQPKYYGGLNASINIKRYDFSVDLYGSGGNKVYNAKKGARYGGNYNVEYDVAIHRWQPGSNNNTYPRAFNGVPYPTDYYIENGSFMRVNNVTAGYTVHPKAAKGHIESVRVYASAQNPFLLTKYTGFTPELPGNQNEAGIELNIYPISSTYTIGLSVQFK